MAVGKYGEKAFFKLNGVIFVFRWQSCCKKGNIEKGWTYVKRGAKAYDRCANGGQPVF